jgi:iron complex transport system substrate-binding protein
VRIVSLVPSATEILCALGLENDIVGISHACDWPPTILGRPRLTTTRLRPELTSCEIDQRVRESLSSGHSLYAINGDFLRKLRPDLVITQEQCQVCAVNRDHTVCAIDCLGLEAEWLSLASIDLAGLYRDIINVGLVTERREAAESLVNQLAARLQAIAQRTASATQPRVFCLSWFDPLMAAGSWISEMVRMAGGCDSFGRGNAASSPISIDRLLSKPPEVIFLMPCSFSQERSSREWGQISSSPLWLDLPAVQAGHVFTLESSLFHRQGPRMVDGVELMASLLHPDCCSFVAQDQYSRQVA